MPKFFEFNSIRSRMVSGFLFLTLLLFILALVSLYTLNNNNEIARVHSNINQLEILTLSLIKSDNDFFDLDVINELYFTTRKSIFLKNRDSLNRLIQIEVVEVLKQQQENLLITRDLKSIDSTLAIYNDTFTSFEAMLFKRGFKDYGMEGLMRFHAHRLEEKYSGIKLSNLLYLRRHEKDFFLRHDIKYLDQFNALATLILDDLRSQPHPNQYAVYHLQQYSRIFNDLVKIQIQIGLSSKQGLRYKLNRLTFALSRQYFELSEFSFKVTSKAQQNAEVFYVILLCGAILFSLLSGLWISKRLSEPIARLSRLVQNVPFETSSRSLDLNFRNAANEINTLTKSFILLMDQTKSQMRELQRKSKLLKKKNKELKKVNRELDNFLYSTAHDLRSPLTSLLGLVNIMRYDNKQEELVVYMDMMVKSINRSENFISQIVNFSKNKRMDIHPERLALNEMVSDIFESHSFVKGSDRIRKEVNVVEDVFIYSDRNRLNILFNNLISNAIRYADFEKEDPYIKISFVVSKEAAIIEFADNGIGIGAEHLDKIFEMFYRANANSQGSGLGLFIFYETVKRLKGNVTVESVIGVGTKFFIRIPNLINEVKQQLEVPNMLFGNSHLQNKGGKEAMQSAKATS